MDPSMTMSNDRTSKKAIKKRGGSQGALELGAAVVIIDKMIDNTGLKEPRSTPALGTVHGYAYYGLRTY